MMEQPHGHRYHVPYHMSMPVRQGKWCSTTEVKDGVDLGNKKRAEASLFKGTPYVGIRHVLWHGCGQRRHVSAISARC